MHQFNKLFRRAENFYADMGDRPAGMTLDRRNNSLGYSRENCRWATGQTQSRNRRTNRLLTHEGKTMTAAAWAESIGMLPATLHSRLHRGWPIARALSAAVDMRFSRA